jgi:hypothetical protein
LIHRAANRFRRLAGLGRCAAANHKH